MHLPTPYDMPEHWSKQFGTSNTEPSLTQQSDALDSDINVLVERFTRTGMIPQVQLNALYGDFSDVTDYKEALDKVQAAAEEFLTVPADIRKKFNNDPKQFVDFATDPANQEELRKMNLAPPEKLKSATLDDVVETLRTTTRYDDNGENTEKRPTGHRGEPDRHPGGSARGPGHSSQDNQRPPGRPNDPGRR